MSTNLPPPNSSPSAVPPVSSTSPPPSTSSPPPSTSVSPPQRSPPTPPLPQTNASPPGLSTPSAESPPPAASSPPPTAEPPPPRQPIASPPPPVSSNSPPSNSSSPPPVSPPPNPSPPPSVPRPAPGPPPNSPPSNPSPPPPTPRPSPVTPPQSPPPNTLSPPPSSQSPKNSPPSPPPPSQSPKSSPPPPSGSASPPPKNSPPSPPPPTSQSPKNSPPPPQLVQSPPVESPTVLPPAPASSPTNQSSTPPSSQLTPPSPPSNSTQKGSPPSVTKLAPPPQVSVPSSDSPPGNNTSSVSPESSTSSGNGGIGVAGAVAIGVAVGIIVLSLISIAVCCWRKQKRKHSRQKGDYVLPSRIGPAPRSDSFFINTNSAPVLGSSSSSDVNSTKDPGGLGNSRSWFTYDELGKATNGFSEHNLLGEGGFGAVYKGCLPDGREVAVKQLKIGGGQGEREFKAEVEIISRIHHRHLVSLVGYCISENQRLLVYEYVPNNNLYYLLHGEGMPVLDWPTRVRIAAGAARGIAYLHEDCHPRIIHRDIKSSNILLDSNFDARVSDFGLAKLALDGNTHISTRVMGTFGYMAPEYATSGKLTDKSDVFSFGVVLLELITGRKPVDTSQPLGDESLVEWARPLLSHAIDTEEYESLADPRLGGNYVESEMFRMIEAAAACVRHSAAKRPRMAQIVRAFESLGTADLSNGMRVGESEVFNSAQQSEEIRWFRRMAFGSQNYSTDYFSDYTGGSEQERNTVHV